MAVVPTRRRPRGLVHFLGGAFVGAAPLPVVSSRGSPTPAAWSLRLARLPACQAVPFLGMPEPQACQPAPCMPAAFCWTVAGLGMASKLSRPLSRASRQPAGLLDLSACHQPPQQCAPHSCLPPPTSAVLTVPGAASRGGLHVRGNPLRRSVHRPVCRRAGAGRRLAHLASPLLSTHPARPVPAHAPAHPFSSSLARSLSLRSDLPTPAMRPGRALCL